MVGRLLLLLGVIAKVDCLKVVDGLDYIGCFQSNNPSFPTQVTPTGGVTPTTCTQKCYDSGYSYAGLKNANECWCTNDLTSSQTGRFTIADEYHYRAQSTTYNRCTTACSDDGNHRCGDGSHFSVYASQADSCLSNPCQNGGTCNDYIDDHECTCTERTYGKNCELGITLTRNVFKNKTFDQCRDVCTNTECTQARHSKGDCIIVNTITDPDAALYGGCWLPQPLGLEDGTIPDNKMTANTNPGGHESHRARLYHDRNDGADGWRSQGTQTNYNWFQVELPSVSRITGVATQGRYDNDERIYTYKIQYSEDGSNWEWYNNEQTITGNDIQHRDSVRTQFFDQPFDALKVRLWMVSALNYAALRMEIYGCPKTWTEDAPTV